MKEKLEAFLTGTFLFEFDDELTHDSDLFKAGILDSMGYIQLIQFIEKEFGIRFAEDELLSSVFVSFNQIAGVVHEKREAPAS